MKQTTFERATSGYDDAHERALTDAIIKVIAETSMLAEPPVMDRKRGGRA
jgi:hypothetical protein